MTDLSQRCLVSGAHGHVSVTPAGRVILTESAPALRGSDLDRIADDVGADVALRTLAANGGTAALVAHDDNGAISVAVTGRVAVLVELPTAKRFVTPTGTVGHTVHIPGDAERFTVGLGAVAPADLTPNTAATLSTPEGQVASQVVVDLRADEASDPTPPAGLEVVDLFAEADDTPEPLPVVSQKVPAPPPTPPTPEPPQPAQSERVAPKPPPPAPTPPEVAAPGPGSAAAHPEEAGDADESKFVLGIRCPLDHHNHPNAGYCAQCGRKLKVNQTAVLVKGPRPPLGLFLLDDGGAIPIATDLVIGRDATTHPEVVAGTRQAVLLTDSSNVVSRHHLEITLQEWSILVTDLGSSNGTVFHDVSGHSHALQPNVAIEINAGDRLQIGPRTLQLELHHVAERG